MDLGRIIDIAEGKEQRYLRKGQCNRCGKCCIEENCECFEIVDGIGICKIYDKPNRSEKCKLFPANPPIIFEECGYYFVDKIDGRVLKAHEV